MERHREHYNNAVEAGKNAKLLAKYLGKDHDAVKVLEAYSLDELGRSLHPLQDIMAHTPQFTKELGRVKYHESPELLNSGPNLADDSTGQYAGSCGEARLFITQQQSEFVMGNYIQELNQYQP